MKTLKQHEQKYYHIPKVKFKLLGLFLLVLTITIFWVYLSITKFGLFEVFGLEPEQITRDNLQVIPDLIFNYLLISFTFICLVALIKGGFDKLKSFDDEGLIVGLIAGLIGGLIGGLIVGLIYWLIWGLIYWLIAGLIVGLIVGLIFGLILGLIAGLILGLMESFD